MALSFVFAGNVEAGKGLAQNLVSAGFPAAASLESADVVVVLCARQSQHEDLFYDTDGIIGSAMPGAYLIDCSPTTPTTSKELSAIATVNDLHLVEAPLVVKDPTVPDAFGDRGNLIALAAGDDEDVRAVGPLLDAMAATVKMCGGAGEGQLAKCAVTVQQCAQLVSLVEADALCRANSAPQVAAHMVDLLCDQQIASPALRWAYDAIRREDFGSGNSYSVEVLWGELEAALAAADDMDLIMPQAEAVLYLLELLATIGGIAFSPVALKLIYSDDETVAKHGLDWSRAEQAYTSLGHSSDDDDDYDYDDDDYEDDYGEGEGGHHHHHHGHGLGFDFGDGFDDWSSN